MKAYKLLLIFLIFTTACRVDQQKKVIFHGKIFELSVLTSDVNATTQDSSTLVLERKSKGEKFKLLESPILIACEFRAEEFSNGTLKLSFPMYFKTKVSAVPQDVSLMFEEKALTVNETTSPDKIHVAYIYKSCDDVNFLVVDDVAKIITHPSYRFLETKKEGHIGWFKGESTPTFKWISNKKLQVICGRKLLETLPKPGVKNGVSIEWVEAGLGNQ